MNLLIQLPTSEIEKRLNAELGEVLHESGFDQPEMAPMQVRVKKRAPIRVRTADDLVVVSAPVHVWTHQGKRNDLLDFWKDIPTVDVEEIGFEITVHIRVRVAIGENWELKTQTSSQFDWDRKPRIGVGLMKFSVTGIVEPLLEKELVALAGYVDDFLQNKLGFREYVRMAWEALQQAHEIDEAVPAWLQLHPDLSSVALTELVCHQNALQVMVHMGLAPVVQIGVAHAPATPRDLPAFRQTEEIPLTSTLPLSAVLPFHELDRLYRGHSYSFRHGKSRFQLDQLTFEVKGERLIVSLFLSGESQWRMFRKKHTGALILDGIPHCDPATQNIVVRDLRYVWKSADPILNLIFRYRRKRLEKVISEYADHLLAETIQDIRRMGAAALRNNALTEQLTLDGQMDSLTPQEVLLEPGGIHVVAAARGRIALRIGNL